MEKQKDARPHDGVVMLFRLIAVQCLQPFVGGRLFFRGITTDRSQCSNDEGRNQSAFAENAAGLRQQVDGEKLQHECRGKRWFHWQQNLPIPFRVQGIAMVVGMAAGIIERVPPADQAEEIKEHFVQPFGLEDSAMPQFVGRVTLKEAGHGAMEEEGDQEAEPLLIPPEAEYQRTGDDEERDVAAGQKPGLGVAAPRKLAQYIGLCWAAVPFDAQGLPYLG